MFKYNKEDITYSPFGCLLSVPHFNNVYNNSNEEVIITKAFSDTSVQFIKTTGLVMWIKPPSDTGLLVTNSLFKDASTVFVRVKRTINRAKRILEYDIDHVVDVSSLSDVIIVEPKLVKDEANYMHYLIIDPPKK